MKEMDLGGIRYVGMDIVDAIVEANRKSYGRDGVSFVCGDVINDELPCVDLVLCRDLLVHLHTDDVVKAVKNIRKGTTHLLATNFPDVKENVELPAEHWRKLNLLIQPFNFPDPTEILPDYADIHVGTY